MTLGQNPKAPQLFWLRINLNTLIMKAIQFINSSPEEVSKKVTDSVNKTLDEFKKHFQPKEPKEYLTRTEVAKLLKIDLSTLWAWTKKGKLNAYGIGNRVYYLRKDIEDALIPLNFNSKEGGQNG